MGHTFTEPLVAAPGASEAIQAGPNRIDVKCRSAETAGRLGVLVYGVAPRFVAPPVLHWHTRESWTAYVTRGTIRFRFAASVQEVGAGGVVHIPPYCKFAWENPSDEAAEMLCVYTPGGFEQYFQEVTELAMRNPGKTVQELMPQIVPLWAKYGIERD